MKNYQIRSSIRQKFTTLVLLNSLFATAILIIIFGAWRYYDIVSGYQDKINSLTPKHLAGIEQSLWLMDTEQTHRQLNELKLILGVDFVEIITHENMISSVGESVVNPLIDRELKITRKEGGKLFELGVIHFQLDRNRILQQLIDELIPIIAIALLAVITPVMMNSFGLQKIVLSRIAELVQIINSSSESDMDSNLETFSDPKSPDELDNLSIVIKNYHRVNNSLTTNLQTQQHQLNAIFDNTKLFLGLIDAHGNLLNINQTTLNIMNFEKTNLLFKPFWGPLWDHYDTATQNKIKTLTTTALKGSVVREELILTFNSQTFYLDINFVPIFKNDIVEFVIVEAQDMSKIRRWESQLSTQVSLLKSLVADNSLKSSMYLIVNAINPFLPDGVYFHILEEIGKNKSMQLAAGGFQNKTKDTNFQELVASLLRSEFTINEPVEIDLNTITDKNLAFLETLDYNKLLISPIKSNINATQKFYTIITLSAENKISHFVKQTASMTTSLVEISISKEHQKDITRLVENNLSNVIDHSIDGILAFDDTGKILISNGSFDELVHLPKENIIGKHFWELPVDSSEQEIRALFNTTKITGSQFHKFILNLGDDKKKHCEITLTIIGEKGNEQYYAFIQDRTEQYMLLQELEEQNQFIHAVLDNTSEGIIACDENARITVFNRAIQEIYGRSIIDNDPDNWAKDYQLFEADGKTELQLTENPLYLAYSSGEVKSREILIRPKDKDPKRVVCNGARFFTSSGHTLGAVVSVRDITEEYNAQQKLTEHQNHLENLVSKRTESMSIANRELEAFAYSVSHDLRAPLRSINGFAKILEEDYSGLISEEGQDYLRRIQRNASHMGTLIEDMLTLSKISRVDMKIMPVNISTLATEILTILKETYPGLTFKVKEHIIIKGDLGLTKILLQNLIENATKYSQHSQSQYVQISAVVSENKNWIEISDNGVGFDEKFLDKIFQPFQRLHGDEYEGTGIGLSSVKRVINRHHGDIKISSKVNEGTTVLFYYGEVNT
ncbi:MAG TPA: PAS domain-containing sensor histidine kinase [Aeromonadales bacterium]|nr:PAS domain-containing sensor histidine kinase [Aeromonadales bacterium]